MRFWENCSNNRRNSKYKATLKRSMWWYGLQYYNNLSINKQYTFSIHLFISFHLLLLLLLLVLCKDRVLRTGNWFEQVTCCASFLFSTQNHIITFIITLRSIMPYCSTVIKTHWPNMSIVYILNTVTASTLKSRVQCLIHYCKQTLSGFGLW